MSAPRPEIPKVVRDPRRRRRRGWVDRGFVAFCIGAASLSVVILAVLLGAIVTQAAERNKAVVKVLQTPRPVALADWAKVDFEALADYPRMDLDAVSDLGGVDWPALAAQQGLSTAADIARVDWKRIKKDQGLSIKTSAARRLGELDWAAVTGLLGQGKLSAWGDGYALDVFIGGTPSRQASIAGVYPSMWGSIFVCVVCALAAIPLGVGTAVLLEEYKPKGRKLGKLHGVIQLNITNLAGVPSIVYGILGLTVFANMFGLFGHANQPVWELGTPENWYYLRLPFDRGVLAGGLTLMLVVLPVVIIATQEALRAVPNSLRQGALALGCTRWQVVRRMTLPAAIPGIMTGTILAMSRAIGEAAPILVISGIVYITFTPQHLMDDFTVLPLQIYNWAGLPQAEFHRVAAAGILLLLTVLLTFNAAAVLIRYKFQRPLS